jgi:hypothetical protein
VDHCCQNYRDETLKFRLIRIYIMMEIIPKQKRPCLCLKVHKMRPFPYIFVVFSILDWSKSEGLNVFFFSIFEYVTPVLSRRRFARSTCTWTSGLTIPSLYDWCSVFIKRRMLLTVHVQVDLAKRRRERTGVTYSKMEKKKTFKWGVIDSKTNRQKNGQLSWVLNTQN